MWHVADAGAWPTIQKHGLLSAARLVDLFRHPDPHSVLEHAEPSRSS